MFSGCKDNQTSADTYDTKSKQWVGAFTEAFIECLRAYGHNVAMPVLHRSICNRLLSKGHKQIPLYSTSSNNPNYVLKKNTPTGKRDIDLSKVSSTKDIIGKNMNYLIKGTNGSP
jgi:hypothetical protein